MFKKIGNLFYYLVCNLIFVAIFNYIIFELITTTSPSSVLTFGTNNEKDINSIILYNNILIIVNIFFAIISILILIRIGNLFHRISEKETNNI